MSKNQTRTGYIFFHWMMLLAMMLAFGLFAKYRDNIDLVFDTAIKIGLWVTLCWVFLVVLLAFSMDHKSSRYTETLFNVSGCAVMTLIFVGLVSVMRP